MTNSGTVGVRIVVRGRVQGVGYRAWLADLAERRGVSGWCRNLATGEVEAVLSGSADAVRAVVKDCENGPRWARVEAVDIVSDADPAGGRFEVRATG